jgi:hypothetical protein
MKYVVTSVLKPGVENAKKALEVFQKTGSAPGTEALFAGYDGKTFIAIVDTDTPDMAVTSTYAPFFESTSVLPVAPMDDAWMEAIQKAVAAWG